MPKYEPSSYLRYRVSWVRLMWIITAWGPFSQLSLGLLITRWTKKIRGRNYFVRFVLCRTTSNALFISYRRGTRKDLSKQLVSSYIREAVSLAYSMKTSDDAIEPLKGFIPHSVRHVSTYLSALKNFSMGRQLVGMYVVICQRLLVSLYTAIFDGRTLQSFPVGRFCRGRGCYLI